MQTTAKRGTQIMREHGVYPLQDTITNNAILSTINGFNPGQQADLYVDAKGYHIIWQQAKTDRNGDAIWNGCGLLMETVSEDVTAEFAAKLDYEAEAPDFTNTPKDDDDDPWSVTSPEVNDGYAFTLCGIKDSEGTHLSHIFATDGTHDQLLLAPGYDAQKASFEHTGVAMAIDILSSDDITRLKTDADILSKAKELLK